MKALAKEAHVSRDSLSDWVNAYKKANAAAVNATDPTTASKKAKPRLIAAPSAQPKTADTEVEQLRKELKAALDENTTLKKAMRFLFASPI